MEIDDIYSTSTVTQVELFGVEEGEGSMLTRPPNWSNIETDPVCLLRNVNSLVTSVGVYIVLWAFQPLWQILDFCWRQC